MEANKNIFSGRKVVKLTWPEIILAVLLIMLLEAVVFYLSAMHSNSVSAMNYVSFAGTITSIILAVIAIIYTMVESIRQSSSTDKLISGALSVQESAHKIGQEVQNLKDLRESITTNSEEIRKLSATIQATGENEREKTYEKEPATEEKQPQLVTTVSNIISSHFYLGPIYASLAMMIVYHENKLGDVFLNKKFVNAMHKVHDDSDIDYEPFKLGFFVFFRMLVAFKVFRRAGPGIYSFTDSGMEEIMSKIINQYCVNTDENQSITDKQRNEVVRYVVSEFTVND